MRRAHRQGEPPCRTFPDHANNPGGVALLAAQRGALRVVVPLRTGKVTAKSASGETLREGVSVAELTERIVSEMVGRDGIEPPTPGFSVLFPGACKCA